MDNGGERRRRAGSSTSSAPRVAALLAFTAVPAVLVVVVGNPLAGGLGHAWRPAAARRRCACWSWRPGWPGPPAARSFSARWWRTCAAARSACARARRSWTALAARIAVRRARPHEPSARPLALSRECGGQRAAGGGTPASHAAITAAHPVPAATAAAPTPTPCSPGDTLWRIADDRLGDGADWTMLAALNLGRDMGGGARFVDPDHAPRRLAPPPAARMRVAAHGAVGAPPGRTARTRAGGGRGTCPNWSPSAWARSPVPRWPGAPGGAGAPRRAFTEEPRPRTGPVRGSRGRGHPAAALRRRPRAPFLRGRQLPAGLGRCEGRRRPHGPGHLRLALGRHLLARRRAVGRPPAGFMPRATTARHGTWTTPPSMATSPRFPYLPRRPSRSATTQTARWLVPLEPGDVLPLLGEAAPALWRAARAAAGSWAWSETILVTEDPEDPQPAAEVAADPSGGPARPLLRRPGLAPAGGGARAAPWSRWRRSPPAT